ncbi:MAG: hypothetical protein O2887_07570 [Bacteroidetes bacterium]|nr:hypothetical protein [Bacteroidota bacterium]MDA1120339.1 hypothetical protein [Bacteroidota bacterium]
MKFFLWQFSLLGLAFTMAAQVKDSSFLTTLRVAGIVDACQEMKIDFELVFAPMVLAVSHPYRSYRWSVSRDEFSNPVINALPPEEEMGWTAWERWSIKENNPVRTAWVLYPVKEPIQRGIINWYVIEESDILAPRLLLKENDLEAQLRLARIDEVAEWLEMDFAASFIDSLSPAVQQIYSQFRWVIIPHVLAANGPVIYALPPKGRSDELPWESWYTDGHTPQIHHVHYTKEKPNTTGKWSEGAGAPQRPLDIFGHIWYWYNDPDMIPALAK